MRRGRGVDSVGWRGSCRRAGPRREPRRPGGAGRSNGGRLRGDRCPGQQRGQSVGTAHRVDHARRVCQVVRRQRPWAALPVSGLSSVPTGVGPRCGGQRDLGRRFSPHAGWRPLRGGQGSAASLHPVDGRRIRHRRHTGQRSGARSDRHHDGSQHRTRGGGVHGSLHPSGAPGRC